MLKNQNNAKFILATKINPNVKRFELVKKWNDLNEIRNKIWQDFGLLDSSELIVQYFEAVQCCFECNIR